MFQSAHWLLQSYYLTPTSLAEPVPDSISVNGILSSSAAAAGSVPFAAAVARGSTSRLRFIAANAISMFNISIDACMMQVIEIDGTDTLPYNVTSFVLNVGQRVSVLVDWTQVKHFDAVYLRVSG